MKNILIVGGGPCGLMTAIILGTAGHKVTLIEKKDWPVDKVCGEGIMPPGIKVLRKYGVLDKIDKALSRKFHGITFIDNSKISADFNDDYGIVIRRTELSRVLYEKALSVNVKLLPKTELVSLDNSDLKVTANVRNERTETPYVLGEFDYTIGCDGLRSKVRKLAGLEYKLLRNQNRIGARIHYQINPWTPNVEVHWNNGIECTVAPTSENCVEFIFCWNKDKIKFDKNFEMHEKLLSFFPDLKEKLKNCKNLSSLEMTGNFAQQVIVPIKDKVILLGDASIFYDPITGEGLTLAFKQAEILANHLANFDNNDVKKQFLSEINYIVNNYLKITSLALFLSDYPFFRKVVFSIVQYIPGIFQFFLAANICEKRILGLKK